MNIEFGIGNNTIRSYRRLSYTPWHALAEFVDNSTQAYFNNKTELDEAFKETGGSLEVDIAYDANAGELSIADTSIGMDLEDLQRSLRVGIPPENADGRSRYGLGLKTAACWIGDKWQIKTKKLGENKEYTVTVDVEAIADGAGSLPISEVSKPESQHYTIIKIFDHNQIFKGRTIGKIKEYLASMYREDFRKGQLKLTWQSNVLTYEDLDERLLTDRAGEKYKREFKFEVDGKPVSGWAGILKKGARSVAGFSILHSGRVVRGYPSNWRPEQIFGEGGRNDLINQRLVGEVRLDAFEVTHTKDDILWQKDEEERVEKGMKRALEEYIQKARKPFKDEDTEGGPSAAEVDTAMEALKEELSSPEMVDQVSLDEVPTPEAVKKAHDEIRDDVTAQDPDFVVDIGATLKVAVYREDDLSPNDPYVIYDSAKPDKVCVIVNQKHPHFRALQGSEALVNYFRHCVYDAISEWKAGRMHGKIDADTVKSFKDQLLRVPFKIHEAEALAEAE